MAINHGRRRLITSVAWLTLFQAGTYLLSFLNVPYLARTLGVAGFGDVAFVISVNTYLWVIIDWGFSLGATREVARAQGDAAAISDVFWRTMWAKGVLSIIALCILVAAAVFGRTPNPLYVIVPGVLNICGCVFSVDWLMQGLERMGLFSFYSLITRALVVLLVFVLVHRPADTWIACVMQGVGGFVAGAAGLAIALRYLSLGRPRGTVKGALREIWEGRHYFLSQSNFVIYAAGAPLVLAFESGPAIVGQFSGAERIVRAFGLVMAPLGTAIYPRINALMGSSKSHAAKVAGSTLYIQMFFGSMLGLALLAGGRYFIIIILGYKFVSSIKIIMALSFVPLLSSIAGALNKQYLIPLGHERAATNIIMGGAACYIIMLAVMALLFGAVGAAFALAMAETIIVVCSLSYTLLHEREFFFDSLFLFNRRT